MGINNFYCSMRHVQRRVCDGLDVLQFFTTRDWVFETENSAKVIRQQSPADAKIFPVDESKVDIDQLLLDSLLGGRQYLLKEPLSTLPKARTQLKWWVVFLDLQELVNNFYFVDSMYVLDMVSQLFLLVLFIWAILKVTGLGDILSDFL